MNLQEHADKIKAAFEAAEKDGFELFFEYDDADGEVTGISFDINEYAWFELNGKRMRKIDNWVVLREESF